MLCGYMPNSSYNQWRRSVSKFEVQTCVPKDLIDWLVELMREYRGVADV